MAKCTLRSMIDGPYPLAGIKGASPMAKQVSEHVQDPVGATKEGFEELNEKQLEYELAKQNMARQLAPVKSVIQHVENTHGLNEDEEMGYQDPNMMDPNMPPNMQQQPGAMQQNNPAMNKTGPGFGPKLNAPSTWKMATPQPMGKMQPGQPQSGAGFPSKAPTGRMGPQAQPQNAAPKKPAAKKTGGATGRSIKVHVSAGAAPGIRGAVGLRQMEAGASLTSLRGNMYIRDVMAAAAENASTPKGGNMYIRDVMELMAGGQGSGCRGPNCGRKAAAAENASTPKEHARAARYHQSQLNRMTPYTFTGTRYKQSHVQSRHFDMHRAAMNAHRRLAGELSIGRVPTSAAANALSKQANAFTAKHDAQIFTKSRD